MEKRHAPRRINRRNFLQRTSIAAGGVLLQACMPKMIPVEVSPTPEPPVSTATPTPRSHPDVVLTLLHTNDTHGHLTPFRLLEYPDPVGGIARRATLVRQIRQQASHVLLIDAGDVHQGCLIADVFQGQPDIELMNELGYEAMGLGNHDMEYGWDTLMQRRAAAFFPILCANLVYADSGKPALNTHFIIQKGGLRIALTSFAGPDWPYIVNAENIPGLRIADPIETARTLIPQLQAQADLIVLLGHQYPRDDQALTQAVPGIHIVIGAHEHLKMTQAVQIGGALHVQAYQWGAYLGRLDVAVSQGRITSYAYNLIPLTADIPADPDIQARTGVLEAELRRLRPERFERIGEAAIDISNEDIRRRETPIGNLICDMIRQHTQSDIGIITSLTVLNALFAGPLIVQDIMDALPYPNNIVLLRLTGEQIQWMLNLSASSSGTGNFCQVSGVRFRVVGGAAADVTVDGQPLDRERIYTVATTHYQVRGATGYVALLSGALETRELDLTLRDVVIAYIRAHSPIRAAVDGRIITE